jgi:hypothetical protein
VVERARGRQACLAFGQTLQQFGAPEGALTQKAPEDREVALYDTPEEGEPS